MLPGLSVAIGILTAAICHGGGFVTSLHCTPTVAVGMPMARPPAQLPACGMTALGAWLRWSRVAVATDMGDRGGAQAAMGVPGDSAVGASPGFSDSACQGR